MPEGTEYWYGDLMNYGETSGIKEITTPSAAEAVVRIAGANRYSTAAEISKSAFERCDTVILAYGMNYADALAGGVYAALYRSPLLIVSGSLSNEQKAYLKSKKPTGVTVFGGEGAVPDELVKKILESA